MEWLIYPLVVSVAPFLLAYYVRRQADRPLSPPKEVEALPAYVPKPSQYGLHNEWNRAFYAILKSTCTQHFGKDYCYNCKTQDVYDSCDCDGITQMSAEGYVVAKIRLFDPSCSYHSKEHYFV